MNRGPLLPMIAFALIASVSAGAEESANDERLIEASSCGDLSAVEAILADEADIDARSAKDGSTALMEAVRNGHREIAEILLRMGADPNIPRRNTDRNFKIATTVTVSGKKYTSESMYFSDAEMQNGYSPLMAAVESGSADMVDLLMRNGADARYVGYRLTEPDNMLVAMYAGRAALAAQGRTALSLAFGKSNPEIFEVFLKYKVEIDEGGYLRDAVLEGKTAFIEMLIDNGVAVDGTNKGTGEKTALMVASEAGAAELCELLIEKDADVNAKEAGSSRTPLEYAVRGGRAEIVDLLLHNGAAPAPHSLDAAVQYAYDHKYAAVIKKLKDHRIKVPDPYKFLIAEASMGALQLMPKGEYFSGLDPSYGYVGKARLMFGGDFGALIGLSAWRAEASYLGVSASLASTTLEVGAFVRARTNRFQLYGLLCTSGVRLENGPENTNDEHRWDEGAGRLGYEAGIRLKVYKNLGLTAFTTSSSFISSEGMSSEERGSLRTTGAVLSMQF